MVKRFNGCGGIVIHWTFCPSCFVNEAGCLYEAKHFFFFLCNCKGLWCDGTDIMTDGGKRLKILKCVIFVKTSVYLPVYRSRKSVMMLTAHFWCTRGKKHACDVGWEIQKTTSQPYTHMHICKS